MEFKSLDTRKAKPVQECSSKGQYYKGDTGHESYGKTIPTRSHKSSKYSQSRKYG